MLDGAVILDADESTFDEVAIRRSGELPVVVDFWASWCGPCRTLGPMLEAAVTRRGGDVVLVKVDVDRSPGLSRRFEVQGIPAVLGLRDGTIVDRFTGAVPAARIEAFLDGLAPGPAARALALAATQEPAAARATLEDAVAAMPAEADLAVALARLVMADDPDRARTLVAPHPGAPGVAQVLAHADVVAAAGADIEALRVRVDAGDVAAAGDLARALLAQGVTLEALDVLLRTIEATVGADRDAARRELLGLFTVLGDDHPEVGPARARLARAIF